MRKLSVDRNQHDDDFPVCTLLQEREDFWDGSLNCLSEKLDKILADSELTGDWEKDAEALKKINKEVTNELNGLENDLKFRARLEEYPESGTTWAELYDFYERYFSKVEELLIKKNINPSIIQ